MRSREKGRDREEKKLEKELMTKMCENCTQSSNTFRSVGVSCPLIWTNLTFYQALPSVLLKSMLLQ